MAITDRMRKAFDDCTVMAGVENDFECVYVTKAAMLYLDEIDAAFRKLAQAEAWQRRARQLKDDNLMLHDKVEMLQRHLAWYRHKVTVLKEENEHLREKLARYRELELVLNGGK